MTQDAEKSARINEAIAIADKELHNKKGDTATWLEVFERELAARGYKIVADGE